MTFEEIRAQVASISYDTTMADAFRKACGVPPLARRAARRHKCAVAAEADPDDVDHAETVRMMTGRIGALDRA